MPIKELIIDRPIRLGPADLQGALEQSIKEQGVIRPILLRTDGLVIDGVRRIKAAETVGLTDVPVVIADDFDVAIAEMRQTREHGLHAQAADHYRAWYLLSETKPLLRARTLRNMTAGNRGKRKGVQAARKNSNHARVEYAAMLGILEWEVQGVGYLMPRVFTPNHPDHAFALRALELVDDSRVKIGSTPSVVHRLRREANVIPYLEQKTILLNAMQQLMTISNTLTSIAVVAEEFTADELDGMLPTYRHVATRIRKITNKLERARGEK